MTTFRKKEVVEAIQWRGRDSWDELTAFVGGDTTALGLGVDDNSESLAINSPFGLGRTWVYPGDWIIKYHTGALSPCRQDIFDQTYEPVELQP